MHASQLKLKENFHFTFSGTHAQNVNENMPNMIPIAYLNENFMDCRHGVNENPSFIPTCFGTQQKVRKQ